MSLGREAGRWGCFSSLLLKQCVCVEGNVRIFHRLFQLVLSNHISDWGEATSRAGLRCLNSGCLSLWAPWGAQPALIWGHEGPGQAGRLVIWLCPSISALQRIRAEHSSIGERDGTVKAHRTERQSSYSSSAVLNNPHLLIYFLPQQLFFSLLFMLVPFSSGRNSSIQAARSNSAWKSESVVGNK